MKNWVAFALPLILTLLCGAIGGCAFAPQMFRQAEDPAGVIAPLPTFLTLRDCELAYGSGMCGLGSTVYAHANIASPAESNNWYMPFAFKSMTGALLNDHFGAPGFYIEQAHYGSYLQPTVIQRYATFAPNSIEFDFSSMKANRHRSQIVRRDAHAPFPALVPGPFPRSLDRPPGPDQGLHGPTVNLPPAKSAPHAAPRPEKADRPERQERQEPSKRPRPERTEPVKRPS